MIFSTPKIATMKPGIANRPKYLKLLHIPGADLNSKKKPVKQKKNKDHGL